MSGLRTHLVMTADGRGVVTAAHGSERALGQLGTKTDAAGRAAGRANVQYGNMGSQGMASARRHAMRLGTAVGALATAFGANEIKNAGMAMDGIESAMRGAAGSTTMAAIETQYLRDESERLGISFKNNIPAYAKMVAAGRNMNMTGRETRDVFSAMAETGVIFDFSAERMTGSLRAVEQMMSKGKVTAEELKLQLGDRLPAVMPVAAKAMGVTTDALWKMMEAGELVSEDFLPKFAAALREEFGSGLETRLEASRSVFARMKNDLFELQVEAARGGFLDGLIDGSNTLRVALGDQGFRDDVTALFNVVGQGAAAASTLLVMMAKNADLVAAGFAGIAGVNFARHLVVVNKRMADNIAEQNVKIAANVRTLQSEVAVARATRQTASAHLFAAQMGQARAKGTVQMTMANVRVTQAETAYAAAVARTASVERAAALATGRLAGAKRALSGAMTLLGGPLGLLTLGVIGLTLAYKKYQKAQEVVLSATEDELALNERLKALQESMIDLSRKNAKATLEEAQALQIKNKAILEEELAAERAIRSRVDGEAKRGLDRIHANRFSTRDIQPARNKKIPVTAHEIKVFGLEDIKGFKGSAEGGTIAFSRMKAVLDGMQPSIAAARGELKTVDDAIKYIQTSIEGWKSRYDDLRQSEVSNAQKTLDALRAKLEMETRAAGMSTAAAATEKLALDLMNKSRKAGIELSLEAARSEAGRHIQSRAQSEARKQWATLQSDLEGRLKASSETADQTTLRTEAQILLTAARAAGVNITLAQIEANLEQIKTLEDEQEIREKLQEDIEKGVKAYDEWLVARSKDLKIAKLTNKERKIEKLAQEKINLAKKAGIVLDEQSARVWADTHLQRIDQMERERTNVTGLPDLWNKASKDISQTWTSMWDAVWNGNIESAADFGDQLLDILKKVAKQAALMMVIRPVLNASGLSGLLGGSSGGLLGGLLGSSAAGAAGGGLSGGVLGGAIGSAAAGGGLLGGLNGLLGGIGGGIGSGLTAIGSTIGIGLQSLVGTTGAIAGAIPGIGGILSGGFGALGSGLGGIAGALGPIGLVAGAVFALTSLLKKTPRVKSYFGADGSGHLQVTSSETRGADDQVTQGIATQVNSILDRLGASLTGPTNFQVLYKPKKNHLSIQFEGSAPQVFDKDDIDGLVSYAVSELLQSSSVSGIDAGLQAALRNAGTITDTEQLDALINEYTGAQNIGQQIRDEIARRENPGQYEIDQLETAQSARRAEVESYRELGYVTQDVVDQLTRLEQIEMDELLANLGDSITGTTNALDAAASAARSRISEWLGQLGIANDNSPLSVMDRRANAQIRYDETLAAAQGGDAAALDAITGIADQLLGLDREATSSAAQRAILYGQVVSDLTALSQAPEIDPLITAVNNVAAVLEPAIAGVSLDVTDGFTGLIAGNASGFLGLDGNLDLSRTALAVLRDENVIGFGGLRSEFLLSRDIASAQLDNNLLGFDTIKQSFENWPTDVSTSNDNLAQSFEDSLALLRAEVGDLRTETIGVRMAVTQAGSAQVAVLDDILIGSDAQITLAEQQGNIEGWRTGTDPL